MRAIILAAGRGSRMQQMTDDKPKCLIELHEKPLIEWQLEALYKAGISDIAIVTGYKRELLTKYDCVEFNNPRWSETNMVSSLACAEIWLSETPCIISYADIFFDTSAIALLNESTADLAIVYDQNWRTLWTKRFEDPLQDAETFRLNTDGTLAEIGQKPLSVDEIQGQYMGLLRFSQNGWHEIQRIRQKLSREQQDKITMTETLQEIINAQRIPIVALPYDKPWGEVDSIADLDCY